VFIASSDDDVDLLTKMAGNNSWRIIPAHDMEMAIKAINILLNTNWRGLLTVFSEAVAPGDNIESVHQGAVMQDFDYVFEGDWKEIESRSSDFSGHKVRLTVMRLSDENGGVAVPPPNQIEERKRLIYSLPGMYHLMSSDEYAEEKRREATLEDR
jgi:hypothetical protein